MAIRYHFDLYPRDDPRDGARVVRFTKLQTAEYRGEANGTGSGRFSIRGDDAEAANIDPRGLQYVRVVREDTVAVTEAVVGGFFLDSGDFTALDEQGTRLLTFGGAGTLSYLARAIMASHTYISPIFTGQDPFDDTWRLYAQSTVYANGNYLGAMLWRVIYEAQHNTPGTHRHADGVNVSDTHADDRPVIRIPDLVMDFDQFNDTNGNAWTVSSGEFKAQTGENVLAVVQRLMQAGLYVSMDPDTFELGAWEGGEHRRTRTGTVWGANVIYFTRPTGDDIDTGNIKSDAKRAITAHVKRTWLLAGGNDVYGDATAVDDAGFEGYYYADVNDATAAAAIAAVQVGARDDAGDTLRIRGRLGTDTSSGEYRPFEDALLDDLATVKTGTGQFDHNDQDFPIAAMTIALRTGGDWDVWYDLGSSYSAASSRQFQTAPVAAHNHPPNPRLCDPATACADLTSGDLTAQTATNGDVESGASTQWTGGAAQAGVHHGGSNSYGSTSGTDHDFVYTFDPLLVFEAGVRYILQIWGHTTEDALSVIKSFGVAGVDEEISTESTPISSGVGNDGNTWALHRLCWTPTADRSGVRFRWQEEIDASGTMVLDDLALYTASNNELAGTSNRAARCDHRHRAQDVTLRPPPGMVATDVQAGFDEVDERLDDLEASATPADSFLLNTGGERAKLVTVADAGSAYEMDLDNGNAFDLTLTEACTVTFAGLTNGRLCEWTIYWRGAFAVTWPSGVIWAEGSAPSAPESGKYHVLKFQSIDGGTNIEATYGGSASSLIVREVAGSDIDPVAELEFDADDFVVTDQTGGVARVALATTTGIDRRILLADGRSTPFTFDDMLQMDDGSDFMWSD